jgi:transketolase
MVNTVEATAINTIRTLAADVVRGANSGHPGKYPLYTPLLSTRACVFKTSR